MKRNPFALKESTNSLDADWDGIQAENKQGPKLYGACQYFQIVTDEGD